MRRLIVLWCVVGLLLVSGVSLQAQDSIRYTSQPDEIAIFFNDIAFVRDTIMLPGDTSVDVVLPATALPDTLILRENGERVQTYSLRSAAAQPVDPVSSYMPPPGQMMIHWESESQDVREVTLEYLIQGAGWTPTYDMVIESDNTVLLNFFAEIRTAGLQADDIDVRLIAGRVDTTQTLNTVTEITANQFAAGYADDGIAPPPSPTGAATIHYVYAAGVLDLNPGETVYRQLLAETLPYRVVNLWHATDDDQVTLIYKVENTAELPLAQGVVRNYRDGLFIGSDFIEQTPVGSEGSVTIGQLQNMRVHRTESQTTIDRLGDRDTRHDIELTLSNFSDATTTLDVVDRYSVNAEEFDFGERRPAREGDNLLRWTLTLEPGETQTITYQYIAD